MAIGPFIQYTPPSVWGPMPAYWSLGSGPLPAWAEAEIRDWCMANVGRMRTRRMDRWIRRYFKRQNEESAKRCRAERIRPIDALVTEVCLDQAGLVTVRWVDIVARTVEIPRDALVPATLTLVAVHDC